MTDYAQSSLLVIIKRSLAALRIAVADAKNEPTRTLVQRVVEECETLSSAIKQLSKRVDLTKFDPPAPVTVGKLDIEKVITFANQLENAAEFGVCGKCGGVLDAPQDSLEEKPG